ncbi:SRPBCC domain-containing protein [Arthrobacter sp. GCM10027362]|uniref:SRPBCC family protein n=1 Tax=Arthrobacter sp. GCM10027362 TaxID=3273379 RepID=UPI00363BA721
MTDALTITRTFAAPRELVYAAWTRPEYFSVWFGTEAVDVPLDTLSLDVRAGGAWTAVMHLPDGDTIHWTGEYTEVDPPARLAFTMNDDPSAPADPAPVTVVFREAGGGTEMTLAQPRGGFTDEQLEQTKAGYNGFFDAMDKLLAAHG